MRYLLTILLLWIAPLASRCADFELAGLTNLQWTGPGPDRVADWTPIAYTSLYSVASGRYMPVNTVWSSLGGSNYQYKADTATDYWTASGVYFANDVASRPLGGAGIVILLRDIYGAFIQSPPLEGGVGTIYYTSKARYPNQTPRVHIQVSTNGTPSSDAEWETILPLNYPYANPQINLATPVVINRLDVRCVRFVLVEESPYDSSLNRTFGAVAFDHIVFSTPWTWIPNTGLWGPDFIEPRMFVLQPIN